MAGSTFGRIFKITTWGESHGEALGVVIDGCPAGLSLSEGDIQPFMDRRKPGTSSITTPRKEDDKIEILSGVFEGKTTGTPISLMVRNTSQISKDYSEIASYYRPGHADFGFDSKYGFRDYRGGGRSSGRETVGRVAAGAVASKILKQMGINVCAYTKSIGDISINYNNLNLKNILTTPTAMPDMDANNKAVAFLEQAKERCDSVGGVMECIVTGVPAGIGEPVFDKLDALLSSAIMSIGAVKAVEIGNGIEAAKLLGSENNDDFYFDNGSIHKKTNHCGGILGGISDGDNIVIRAHVKPTPSIFKTQNTINKDNQNIQINIKGRHDPIVVPRAVVVMESMVAITILDSMLVNMGARLDRLVDFYKK